MSLLLGFLISLSIATRQVVPEDGLVFWVMVFDLLLVIGLLLGGLLG